ncbi:hypothetical protein RhiirA4_486777 [Rhizophagus irregularis]|uniref:Uncharacterized protein n=1 Tax=Rhizophagus irregularis TaxID=588596 RepID=A0A2I1HRV8_9GLOM|nr:hypothetical protein RhiirA4_486777 [Rhizophagus irregularis]
MFDGCNKKHGGQKIYQTYFGFRGQNQQSRSHDQNAFEMNNITPKEAVEVIKEYRVDGKIKYIQNKVTDDASGLKEVKENVIDLFHPNNINYL